MAQIVLATVGSLGDLHPFIAVAARLKQLGCEPIIASVPDYAERVTAAGIRFCAAGPSIEGLLHAAGLPREEFARQVLADARFLLRRVIFPHVRASYTDLLPLIAESRAVLTSTLAFGGQLAAERLGRPRLAVVLQPLMFFSAYDPPRLFELPWLAALLARLGPRAAAVVLRQLRWLLRTQAAPLRRLRRELGLPALRVEPIFEGQFSAAGNVALYSARFAAPQPDYPPSTTIAGFAFHDEGVDGATALAPALRRFLESGPPPLVFTLGSFATDAAGDFYEVSLEAARRLGRRAVMLVGEHAASRCEPDAIACEYVPYAVLFPWAEAIVHHGGIGTTAQALRAGKPQLIVPLFADQLDNATRAQRLSLARTVPRRRYRLARVIGELQALLAEPRYRQAARAFGESLRDEDGAGAAARFVLERL